MGNMDRICVEIKNLSLGERKKDIYYDEYFKDGNECTILFMTH